MMSRGVKLLGTVVLFTSYDFIILYWLLVNLFIFFMFCSLCSFVVMVTL